MGLRVVMMGATGAVGSHAAKTLAEIQAIEWLTLLGRRPLAALSGPAVQQRVIDVLARDSYAELTRGHSAAICTLGIGQPSKVSKEQFVRIDKVAVLDFAAACREAGVQHFEVLTSVGSSPRSPLFYLRVKGDLEAELAAMGFDRLSIFQPSMILTPTNRYGISQAITLRVWPCLKPFLVGSLRKYRGIPVERLGRAMATNLLLDKSGTEILHWDDFESIGNEALE